MRRKQNVTDNKAKRVQKKPPQFRSYMRTKLVVFCTISLCAVGGLTGRLIYITATSEDQYTQQILSQQSYDSVTLPYKRGEILDTNLTTLAMSQKVYNVILDVDMMLSDEAFFGPTLQAIELCFDVDMDAVREYVASNEDSKYYRVIKQIDYDTKAAYEAYVEQYNEEQAAAYSASGEKNPGNLIKGIWFEEEYTRVYPYDTVASEVLGFTGNDNNGMFGLEEYYNDVLNGTNGREYGYLDEENSLTRTTKPATDGNSIVTNIDFNIQSIVEREITRFMDDMENNYTDGPGAQNLGVIVMDIHSGAVLAMATNTPFNPNDPYDLSAYFTEEEIARLEQDNEAYFTELNSIWRNFTVTDTYEPGSVAKPFTTAMGLEVGDLTGNEVYECTGFTHVAGKNIHCVERSGHGAITLSQGIQYSCNVVMMDISADLGIETFSQFQNVFGFGLKSNVDLAGEARTASLIHTEEVMGPQELATDSFGQGFQTTMIQVISSFSSLINGGYLYEPQVVRQVLSPTGEVVENIEPKLVKQTISATTSEKIVEFCNNTVIDGSGEKARPAGYAIGGKTATSETLPRGNGEYVASFMGFAPADDPQIAIYVVIDRPNIDNQAYGSKYACWLTRDILTDVLPYMNIFMTEELSEEEVIELEERQNAVIQSYQEKRDADTSEDWTEISQDNEWDDLVSDDSSDSDEKPEEEPEEEPED